MKAPVKHSYRIVYQHSLDENRSWQCYASTPNGARRKFINIHGNKTIVSIKRETK